MEPGTSTLRKATTPRNLPDLPIEAAGTEQSGKESAGSRPWWIWPHLFSLDAPIVAAVWLWAFGSPGGAVASPSWPVFAGLFLAVWAIYLADRLLDGRRLRDLTRATTRHQFYRAHAFPMAALLCAVCLAGGGVALFAPLPPVLWPRVGVVLVFVALYGFLFVKGWLPGGIQLGGKEAGCGLVFALGVAAGLPAVDGWTTVNLAAFGLLCATNCLLISCWDAASDRVNDRSAAAVCWPALARRPWILPAGLTFACAGLCLVHQSAVTHSLLGAAGLLWLLESAGGDLPTDARRVLADVCLLTPLAGLWL